MLEELDRGLDTSQVTGVATLNSSKTSMSCESCNSSNRLSFDATFDLPTCRYSPESLSLKPHRSSELPHWNILQRRNKLTSRDFRLLQQIGSGDIGTVYLCRIRNSEVEDVKECCLFAMKVVDKEALAMKKKSQRAEMERKIIKMVDHPFLPTLYAEFEVSHYSCIVMEYCAGGDLHSLRHRQPLKRFPLTSARFYAAEVLVAMEYLHLLGIVYRDLKPENVLVRSDGHIMLSDFDLCLCSNAIPAVESSILSPDCPILQRPAYSRPHPARTASTPFSCLPNRLFRSRKVQTLAPNRLFVAEPVTARSCSFVGTHEYVAPEVAAGRAHGNAVDWWAFGIFLYEMIYGVTPFAASSNETTLRNIVKKPLTFPTPKPSGSLDLHARDLISGLLNKDPDRRIGSKRGSAEVKKHPFFEGLNFALIRCLAPPEIPALRRPTPPELSRSKSARESTASEYF